MSREDFRIYEGETFTYTFPELRDDNDNLIDLNTGYSAKIQLRDHYFDDTTRDEWVDGDEITLNSDGTIDIEVSSTETESYDFDEVVYDLRLEDPNGDISYPYNGHIFLDRSVTKS